ncbi:MAG TPA: DUF305 domain-containing protein [Geminicoccus sp.]|jgi:uncharacterized protein (DUF305 family)|uniref:CopM family metallochaperone n=1 Tax=Geminicoccus sp. TaxID=2024832 RepID=UPI002E36BA1D|nr:DUF305 domain-containing protein [Geminicoccus sp.]HEX2526708.1 DUF305 domain-containing protein [Geminicoccus sp.]
MRTLGGFLVAGLLAWGSGAMAQDHSGHDMPAATKGGSVAEQLAAINDRMHQDMNAEISGDPDVDFVRAMIPHHQGAIEMAQVILKRSKDPEVRKLAEEIISAQETEIAWMRAFLSKRGY